jgi:hypothetical protein
MSRVKLPRSRGGFALIVTLSLLALLVLAVYALSVLVRVGGKVSVTTTYQLQARQNAALGLSMALAELQRLAGPDGAVTAQSSIKQTTFPNQRLTGVWLSGTVVADPATWLISGNHYPSTLLIDPSTAIPAADATFVPLVESAVTAAADKIRAKKIAIASPTGQIGNYAYWAGDEGCKASVYVPTSKGTLVPAGVVIRSNPVDSLSNYSVNNALNANLVSYDQIRSIASGSNLKANFHHLTATAYGFPAGGTELKAGIFNINTRSDRAWTAMIQAYNDLPIPAVEKIPQDKISVVGTSIGAKISTRVVSGAKVSRGPFTTVSAFRLSGIVAEALTDAGINSPTGDQVLDQLESVLAVRSDTFRLRAFGESLNPATNATEATAYCEAIVQRTPELIDATLGRRFVIIYFRWLGPDDI